MREGTFQKSSRGEREKGNFKHSSKESEPFGTDIMEKREPLQGDVGRIVVV